MRFVPPTKCYNSDEIMEGMYGGEEKFIQGFCRKHEGKEPKEDPHTESIDDIKMYLTETGLKGVE
jgi:uncharacterized protein YneR